MISDHATIVRGSDRDLKVLLRLSNGEPFDLNSVTEITARFLDENGTAVEKTMTGGDISIVSPSGAGRIKISLDITFTGSLQLGERQDIELVIVRSGVTYRHILREVLTVDAQLGA